MPHAAAPNVIAHNAYGYYTRIALNAHGYRTRNTLNACSTKATQMDAIVSMFGEDNVPDFTVALGDAPNDIPMLDKADLGIIIANPAHGGIASMAGEATGDIVRSAKPGPEGWNNEMLRVLDSRSAV